MKDISQQFNNNNNEVLSFFMGKTEKHDAFMIWLEALSQLNKNPSFIPRANFLRNKVGLGRHRYDKAMKYLKDNGLVETYAVRGEKGRWNKSQYMFYEWESRIKDPSPVDKPGPQKNTKAATKLKRKCEGKNSALETLKALSNKQLTDCSIYRQSENPTIYIQGGDVRGGKGEENQVHIKKTLTRFSSFDPEAHTKTFLKFFPGQNTFLTFDDAKKDRKLTKVYKKTNLLTFDAINNKGAGIFLTINETDGKGRKKNNIVKVRAVFADLDGAPLEPVLEYNPSLVVESSPGRYHAYWLTDDIPTEQFRDVQKNIANTFNSDSSVNDLPRVMRIPGYLNNKYEDPFFVKILYTNDRKYSFDEIKQMFPNVSNPLNPFGDLSDEPIQINGVEKGQRNKQLCIVLGGMKKNGCSEEYIQDKAHQFGKTCRPPLSKSDIESVLKATDKWN
jgi:hypothetical protein